MLEGFDCLDCNDSFAVVGFCGTLTYYSFSGEVRDINRSEFDLEAICIHDSKIYVASNQELIAYQG
jgi:hypothetical protein